MSCHVVRKLSNVRLSFGVVLLFSSPFRMVLRFLFLIGWYWLLPASLEWRCFTNLPSLECFFPTSCFRAVLLFLFLFGWCWRFLLLLAGVAFSSSIILGGAAVFPSSSWVVLISSLLTTAQFSFSVLHWYIAHMTCDMFRISWLTENAYVSESMKFELDLIWSNELKLKWRKMNHIKLN